MLLSIRRCQIQIIMFHSELKEIIDQLDNIGDIEKSPHKTSYVKLAISRPKPRAT